MRRDVIQRLALTGVIPNLAVELQRALGQFFGFLQLSHVSQHTGNIVHSSGQPALVSDLAVDREGFLIGFLRARQISLIVIAISKIVQGMRHSAQIPGRGKDFFRSRAQFYCLWHFSQISLRHALQCQGARHEQL